MTRSFSRFAENLPHARFAAILPPGLQSAVKAAAAQDACHPSGTLSKILGDRDYLELNNWICATTSGPGRAARELRHAKNHAAVELAKCGVPVADMELYAIRQIIDTAADDPRCDNVQRVATAYAAIHTAGAGAATGGILRVVRDTLR
jgi:hypothetical protein